MAKYTYRISSRVDKRGFRWQCLRRGTEIGRGVAHTFRDAKNQAQRVADLEQPGPRVYTGDLDDFR